MLWNRANPNKNTFLEIRSIIVNIKVNEGIRLFKNTKEYETLKPRE